MTGVLSEIAWLRKRSAKQQGRSQDFFQLLQLRVLRVGFLQDGDVGIGVFPEGEEILIRGAGLGGVALQGIGAGKLEMSQSADWIILDNSAMGENFLEFNGGFASLMRGQIRFATQIRGIERCCQTCTA